jgi:hypothetical protein
MIGMEGQREQMGTFFAGCRCNGKYLLELIDMQEHGRCARGTYPEIFEEVGDLVDHKFSAKRPMPSAPLFWLA